MSTSLEHPPHVADFTAHPKDLEDIVTSMEIAAILLTPVAGATFTFDELLAKMRWLARMDFDEKDVRLVVNRASYCLRKSGKKLSLR